MKVANLSRAKADLSRYVAYVRRGGRVRITVGGVPVADMVPVAEPIADDSSSEDLLDLERLGVVRLGTGRLPSEILKPGPKLRGEASSVTVTVERADGW